ncbi:reverse transcriptase domain-containing protein [Sinimarinibacterium flocculans]|uniref:Reverse transcriptase (RNA-dependent DNA polymerase) n=1 Tax=Sinimarinibacterium flocculans TaxID=985250 RepID=A0A318E8I3_9GAMM|nr:reverse transcriptase domain-containing protein [Sinimarinibacterium flocculans]PXV68327.1 reverse transcriptase (RNA-dependent DNA polymerase) [Sinimarinibacterium flocculans]
MEKVFRSELTAECHKHIRRHEDYLRDLEFDAVRIEKRTGVAPIKRVQRPGYWSIHRNFDPYRTRSERRVASLSYGLARRFLAATYDPAPALIYTVPKASGGERHTNVFQIPDAVVSRFVYSSLVRKNRHRMSGYSYAYRSDIGSHEAVVNIQNDFIDRARVYAAEYDFSAFFDNIRHDFLWKMLDRGGFQVTNQELHILERFAECPAIALDRYLTDKPPKRARGIPQGTSVSLFLANAACWGLDRALERTGVGFARYADDTVIWSEDYARIVDAYEVLKAFSMESGVPINDAKSEGINLITDLPGGGEIRSKSNVVFLGYSISTSKVSISQKHLSRIKRNISKLIYCNLLQAPRKGLCVGGRYSPIDWDYLVCIAQIRRYLYGGLRTIDLLNYTRGVTTSLRFRGLMSYYPIVSDIDQLRGMDGWLLHCLKRALSKRQRLVAAIGGPSTLPGPRPDWIQSIEKLRTESVGSLTLDYRLPSFSLIL